MNPMQASFRTARETNKMGQAQAGLVQAGVGLSLVGVIAIFGLVIVSQATGQESVKEGMTQKAPLAQANVLPKLVIHTDALQPGLNGVLATGDGGAMIETTETGEKTFHRR